MSDCDPETYGFEVKPRDESRHLVSRGDHVLEISSPNFCDDRWSSATLFCFYASELTDLRDTITRYLEAL